MGIGSQKSFKIFSLFLILTGILANPWMLGFLFTKDGHIAELSDRVFVWIFQLSLLFFGPLIFFQRSFLNKKRFAFSLFRSRSYYTDWCHLSEEGNEVVATKIFEIFEKEFLK